jgi:beta-lactamase regulating signal transducer with metallopeptidase domain
MLHSTFQYLIESTIFLIIFLLLYRMIFVKSTHFVWMRIYLMVSLILILALPLITLPGQWFQSLPGYGSIGRPLGLTFLNVNAVSSSGNTGNVALENTQVSFRIILAFLLISVYIIGALFSMHRLLKKLYNIRSSILQHSREKRGKFWFIQLENQTPACSFLRYIFLSKNLEKLSASEKENIISHETIHAIQWHTLDILFAELVSVLLWFNPLMKIFSTYLREVHEYLADEKILNNTEMKKSYSHLLLKLTTEEQAFSLSSGFSAKLINRRIRMMDKARSLPRQKLLFLLLLPAAAVLLMSFSYFEHRSLADTENLEAPVSNGTAVSQVKVGNISWEGNTLYTDPQLTEALGIKSGDAYSKDYLNERLYLATDAVNSLYLDKGYLFFQLEVKEVVKEDGTMDLTITIYEGAQAKIGQITIEGNGSVPKQDIMEVILIKKGELFSKTKLINSVRAISQMNKFDPEKIFPNPIPKPDQFTGEYAVVDIEFKLTEK